MRLFHLHVYQVIFKTCLVLPWLFYFNKQKETRWSTVLTSALSIQMFYGLHDHQHRQNGPFPRKLEHIKVLQENSLMSNFRPSHKHGGWTPKLNSTVTKNSVLFFILNDQPLCKQVTSDWFKPGRMQGVSIKLMFCLMSRLTQAEYH